jgi:GSH-dependent disulfide-bond oxidoreductase
MIDLYYAPTPNGWKFSIMLEECGLPYNLHLIQLGRGDRHASVSIRVAGCRRG